MYIPNPTARLGEKLAGEFLEKQGYKIIERNFRKGYGEIDIIALDKKTLVFVEIKTKTSNAFGTPFEAITPFKIKALERSNVLQKVTPGASQRFTNRCSKRYIKYWKRSQNRTS